MTGLGNGVKSSKKMLHYLGYQLRRLEIAVILAWVEELQE
jgi:hypothetical protein